MAKEYRRYRCDHGHEWIIFKDESELELPENRLCPEGHEVVTLQREKVLGHVQITFRPAGRIIDSVKGQSIMEGRYYVVIDDLLSSKELVTDNTFTWDEACKFARKFDQKSIDWVLKYWSKFKSYSPS